MATFQKDPNEVRYFDIDLGLELAPGETITAHSVAGSPGITVDSSAVIGEIVRLFLSGGTLGITYTVTITYNTSLGQILEAAFTVEIIDSASIPSPGAPGMVTNAEAWNLLPLEEWRAALGFHPYHFWQVEGAGIPVLSSCNALVRQYAWQRADAVGRAEIRAAILSAEEMLRKYLGYSIAPHYLTETIAIPRFLDRRFEMTRLAGAGERWRAVQLSEGFVRALGVETLAPIALEAEVVYSDSDGDGVNDTFSVITPTSVLDPDEIALYFCAADRLNGDAPGERWRLLPLTVKIAGGVATISGRAWQLVRPRLYEGAGAEPIRHEEPANFAALVDIYRRYTSAGTTLATAQAVLVWETRPAGDWGNLLCAGSPSDPAGETYALARVSLRDAEMGVLGVGEAVYDAASATWHAVDGFLSACRPPDRVIVRALAGAPMEGGRVAARFRTLVARLAAAELARAICACESANRELYNWQFDLSRAAGVNDEQYTVSGDALTNPFGTRRGHVYAWRQALDLRQERGFAI